MPGSLQDEEESDTPNQQNKKMKKETRQKCTQNTMNNYVPTKLTTWKKGASF